MSEEKKADTADKPLDPPLADNVAAGDAANKAGKKKKKKGKKKNKAKTEPALDVLGDSKLLPQFENLDLSAKLREARPDHPFWSSQPVLHMREGPKVSENEAIEVKTLDEVRKEPLSLPEGFEWVEVDVTSDAEMKIIYDLLNQHYVTDDDGIFRFDYGIDLLRWAICPPGWKRMWHIGVRRVKNQQIIGFITAVPCETRVYGKPVKMVEINFLCVNKGYRDKRIAPVLIKEITRRVNLNNIWQAVFTAGVVLPHPLASCRYYHRSLNPRKLIDVRFSHKNPKLTMSATIKLYALPEETATPGLRPLEKRDVPAACALLNAYLSRFHLAAVFSEEEFAHWFLTIPGVIYSYVVQSPKDGRLTDFISFYRLPSSVLGHPVHSTVNAGYSFYNVAGATSWVNLMRDALILAKREKLDVFNCLDVMENDKFISELKFGKGDGNLQMYLFNWKCPPTKPEGVGLVLM